MANDMLKKYVAEKRTGANLVGIQVDTQSSALLDRGTGPMMLNALEEIAKRADIARIENEKQNLLLTAGEMDLKFQNERLTDPLLYKDEEKYNAALTDFNKVRKEKESLIAKSSFLTLAEKKQMLGRLKNNDEKILIDMLNKRNTTYIQQQTDEVGSNIRRQIEISGQLSLNDLAGREENVAEINKLVGIYQDFTKISDAQASEYVSESILASEEKMFSKELRRINTSNYSSQVKMEKLKGMFSLAENEKALTRAAEGYASQIEFTKTDEEFKTSVNYFKARIKDMYSKLSEEAYKQFDYIKAKEEAAYERAKNKELERINKENKAYNENSYSEMINAQLGYTQKWTDNLGLEVQASTQNNPNISPAYKLYGMGLDEINTNGMFIKDFIPQETMKDLNNQIEKRMNDLKKSRFDATTDILSNIVIDLPEEVAEAVINSFAVQNGEYQQNEYKTMLKGIKNKDNSEFIRARDFNNVIYRGGNVSNTEVSIAMQIPEISRMADKVVKESKNRITPAVAYKTITQLYMGVNSITGTVPVTTMPNDKNYDEFLRHIFTDKGGEINRQLIKTLGSEESIIDTIVNLKDDRKILFPAPMVGGMK